MLAIIHKRTQPNLATHQSGQYKSWEPCYIVWQHATTCCLNMATSKNICPDNVATKVQKAFVLVARPFF